MSCFSAEVECLEGRASPSYSNPLYLCIYVPVTMHLPSTRAQIGNRMNCKDGNYAVSIMHNPQEAALEENSE
jgi:hypothetical protein